jgi:RNA polymerase sigma-70 factor (ECF subfamily)
LNSSPTYTEAELVAGLKSHDNKAYRYLYMNYRGALYNAINQVVYDKEIAADILQDTFVTVWKNIDKYDATKGKLFTWLLRLARNAAINTTRSKVYKSEMKNDGLDSYVNHLDEKSSQQLNTDSIGLRKQVGLLREEYRAVLELSYYQGFTQEEVSKTLGVPLGTVKTRLRNAVIELRKQFSL